MHTKIRYVACLATVAVGFIAGFMLPLWLGAIVTIASVAAINYVGALWQMHIEQTTRSTPVTYGTLEDTAPCRDTLQPENTAPCRDTLDDPLAAVLHDPRLDRKWLVEVTQSSKGILIVGLGQFKSELDRYVEDAKSEYFTRYHVLLSLELWDSPRELFG